MASFLIRTDDLEPTSTS